MCKQKNIQEAVEAQLILVAEMTGNVEECKVESSNYLNAIGCIEIEVHNIGEIGEIGEIGLAVVYSIEGMNLSDVVTYKQYKAGKMGENCAPKEPQALTFSQIEEVMRETLELDIKIMKVAHDAGMPLNDQLKDVKEKLAKAKDMVKLSENLVKMEKFLNSLDN